MKKLISFILFLLMLSGMVQAEYYMIPDYSWTWAKKYVVATAQRITAARSCGLALQAVGNDVYMEKNATANLNSFKIANGSTVDFESMMLKKGEYITLIAPSSTTATVNYTFKQ